MTARINVNIGPATEAALQRMVDREGVTLTEAVRRLVGYGDLLRFWCGPVSGWRR